MMEESIIIEKYIAVILRFHKNKSKPGSACFVLRSYIKSK